MTILVEHNRGNKKNAWGALRELSELCEQYDTHPPKLYWQIIQQREDPEKDFYLYKDNQLIAYLSYFFFNPGEAEITAMTHPLHRQRGYFNQLFRHAKLALGASSINALLLPCAQGLENSEACLRHLGAHPTDIEYTMAYSDPSPPFLQRNMISIEIRTAEGKDMFSIMQLDRLCFREETHHPVSHYQQLMQDPKRQCWLASAEGSVLGKLHIRLEENAIFIHDIAVIPSLQGKGIGRGLLQHAITHYSAEKPALFHLDVRAQNSGALRLYQRCGFRIQHAYQYWKLNL